MKHRASSVARRRTRGFSLVEVLISIIVLSFGMLGMVGMQAASLQANREARLQSVGAVLARELADMMRGNQSIGIATGTANPYLGSFNTSPLVATTPTYCLTVGATACTTPTAVANAQMTEWLARVDDALPGARVQVCVETNPYGTDGLPQWSSTCSTTLSAGTADVIYIKIGWTKGSTNRAATGASALERASDTGARPSIIFAVTAGN